VRYLIHRPGLSLPRDQTQFGVCLQTSTEAAIALIRTSNRFKAVLPYIKCIPSAHPLVIFVSSDIDVSLED
jgi:hypothetical protein